MSRRQRIWATVLSAVLLIASAVIWQRSSRTDDRAQVTPTTHGPTDTNASDPHTSTTVAGQSQLEPAAACGASTPPGEEPVTVSIDGRRQFQTMDGFGTTVRLFDDPHLTETFNPATGRSAVVVPAGEQDAILDRLYRDLRLTRVRPATDAGIEVANDNDDPAVTDLTKFNFDWKRNDGFVDYQRRVAPWGVTGLVLSPVKLEDWMGSADPAEYAEWAMAIVRRWRSQGIDVPLLSVVNEPGGAVGVSGEYIRDVIKLLGPRLRAEGFPTRMMVPDDINPGQAYSRLTTVLADPDARQYVGAVAYHLYGGPSGKTEIAELANRYGLPVWMTEYYQGDGFAWANTVHELIGGYGISAVDYLWGFFGQWVTDGDQLITINYTGDRYAGFVLNKQYYTFGQFSRFVEPGSRRVAADSSDCGVRTTAYVKDGRLTVVAINNGSAARPTEFALSDVPSGGQAIPVMTDATENWKQLAPVTVDRSRFSATLAPGSITTFTSTR